MASELKSQSTYSDSNNSFTPLNKRIDIQSKLEEILKSRNVYGRPPESGKMQYPAIKYSRKRIDTKHANDAIYASKNCYEVIVISRTANNPVIEELLRLPYCSYDRPYIADNLYHDVLTLYY